MKGQFLRVLQRVDKLQIGALLVDIYAPCGAYVSGRDLMLLTLAPEKT